MPGRGQAVTLGGLNVPLPITIILPGYIGPAATDILSSWLRINGPFDLGLAHITAKVAANTTAPSWDILRSTNDGSSFATILPSGAGNKLVLPVSVHIADLTPAWTVVTLDDGDLIRVDIARTDGGNCSDVMIVILPAE